MVDLYGGDFYVDSSSRKSVLASNNAAAAAGSSFVNQKLKVGDIVYRDFDGYVLSEGVFAQGEYNRDKLSVFISGSVSNTTIEIEVITELSSISRKQTIPVMEVLRLRHCHNRTILTRFIQSIYFIIRKCTVGFTESHIQVTIVTAIPVTAIRTGQSLTGIAISTTDRSLQLV